MYADEVSEHIHHQQSAASALVRYREPTAGEWVEKEAGVAHFAYNVMVLGPEPQRAGSFPVHHAVGRQPRHGQGEVVQTELGQAKVGRSAGGDMAGVGQ